MVKLRNLGLLHLENNNSIIELLSDQLDLIIYVTDGNIMYLTDASRFLISCVIQHSAPVVG